MIGFNDLVNGDQELTEANYPRWVKGASIALVIVMGLRGSVWVDIGIFG